MLIILLTVLQRSLTFDIALFVQNFYGKIDLETVCLTFEFSSGFSDLTSTVKPF